MQPERFVFLPDLHWGFQRVNRRKVPIHSWRCLDVVGQFLEDFKPTTLIWGGDTLDCGAISHHNRDRKRSIEGLRILEDAKTLGKEVILPFDQAAQPRRRIYGRGNHEEWLEDVVEDYPGLEGVLDLQNLLPLDGYDVIPQGEVFRLGKLHFLHGDIMKGGQNHSRWAVTTYAKSLRYGHFHSYQVTTRTSPLDASDVHTAVSVPCLCTRGPAYSKGAANAWINGFNFGWVHEDGSFSDQVAIIPPRGRVTINGKRYSP